jgi:hypothetical protein
MKIRIKKETKSRRYKRSSYEEEEEVEVEEINRKEEEEENNNQRSNNIIKGGKRPKPFGTTYRPKLNPEGDTNQFDKREFSTINSEVISGNVIIDNTKSNEFINRENTLYKYYYIGTYNKIDTNQRLKRILEDMYDNNEFVVFNMYFMVLPEKVEFKIDIENFLSHMREYDTVVLNNQIVKVFKNVGMVLAKSIIV